MEEVLGASGANAIVTYTKDIDDAHAFIAESLFYSRLFDTYLRPEKIVKTVRGTLAALRMKYDVDRRFGPSPMKCFTR